MPKLPIFRFGSSQAPSLPELQFQAPALALTDLQLGVDNLRYDVHLSPRVTEELSRHLSRYICLFGGVESLLDMDVPNVHRASFMRAPTEDAAKSRKPGAGELKTLLVSLHQAILNLANEDQFFFFVIAD